MIKDANKSDKIVSDEKQNMPKSAEKQQKTRECSPFDLSYIMEQKSRLTVSMQHRCDHFLKALSSTPINVKLLQFLSFHLIPDEIKGLRSLCWKVLLNYLSPDQSKWEEQIRTYKKNYNEFVQDFIVNPQQNKIDQNQKQDNGIINDMHNNLDDKAQLNNMEETGFSQNNKTQQNLTEDDLEQWDQIEKDTKRTRGELHFFQSPSNSFFKSSSQQQQQTNAIDANNECLHQNQITNNNEKGIISKLLRTKYNEKDFILKREELHYDALSRILFIYSKLNNGVRYVQGMNELIGVLYHCFAQDNNPYFLENIECDVFYCFCNLMAEAKDSFIKNMDQSEDGINKRIQILNQLLKRIDFQLWEYLEDLQINPLYYSFRWLMLWLTQEFQLHEVTMIWDSLLAHPSRMTFLNYICVAMILISRKLLYQQEYSEVIQVLQKTPHVDVPKLIMYAHQLFKQYTNNSEVEDIPHFLMI